MFMHALYTLVRALLALLASLGTAAPAPAPAPAPVHAPAAPGAPVVRAPRPPARTGTVTPAQARTRLLAVVRQHGGHVVATGTYGYGPQGQHTALNGGVWVQVGPGQCVGYETYGVPGYFGNMYGFTGGDCS